MAGRFDPRIGAEVGELYYASAGVHGTERRCDAGHMVGRYAHEGGFIFFRRHELHRAHDVGHQMLVAQHGGLRHASGAGW